MITTMGDALTLSQRVRAARWDRDAEAVREIAASHARNAASWVEIDSSRVADWYLRGIEDGDPEVMDALPAADLSVHWADEHTVPSMLAAAGLEVDTIDPETADELADVYCNTFAELAELEISKTCREYVRAAR